MASSVKRCTIIVERVMNQPGHSQPATVTLLVLGCPGTAYSGMRRWGRVTSDFGSGLGALS